MTDVASGYSPQEPVGGGTSGIWTPLAWHYGPDELIAQARAQNEAGYQGVFASAGRGSQPPAYSADHELSQA